MSSPGDPDAWETIYRRLWPFVFSITVRIVDPPAAEDAAQDAFLRTAQKFPFQEGLDEKVFLFFIATVARRVAIDIVRKRLRRREVPLEEAGAALEPLRPNEDADLEATVQWLMRQLSPADAELAQKLVNDGPSSITNVAADLGVSYGAAAVRLHRLRNRLRKLLTGNRGR